MIACVEYESDDGTRTATVLKEAEKRWHVLMQIVDHRQWATYAKATYRPSLTSAQQCARIWVSR